MKKLVWLFIFVLALSVNLFADVTGSTPDGKNITINVEHDFGNTQAGGSVTFGQGCCPSYEGSFSSHVEPGVSISGNGSYQSGSGDGGFFVGVKINF